MNKFLISILLLAPSYLTAKIEVLDRIAIIVDDGVVMESQVKKAIESLEEGYQSQNMQVPPREILIDQVNERLIKLSEIIYPIEPMYISTFLPSLSIKLIPTNVNITLVKPIPILFNSAALWPRPPSSNILRA